MSEKASAAATRAVAAIAPQLDVSLGALERIARQRAELESTLQTRWVKGLKTAHRRAVQTLGTHLQGAAAVAPALDRLATMLERARGGPSSAIMRPPAGFDITNEQASIRNWLDLAIEQRLLN